jgi:hypothetical protein
MEEFNPFSDFPNSAKGKNGYHSKPCAMLLCSDIPAQIVDVEAMSLRH